MDSMAEFISQKRKQAGLTQKQLADKLGVTDKAVSKWERGFSYPDTLCIQKLAEIFGVSTDELLSAKRSENTENKGLFGTVIKAVGFALCVAAIVLSILKTIDISGGITLIGISLLCLWLDKLALNK